MSVFVMPTTCWLLRCEDFVHLSINNWIKTIKTIYYFFVFPMNLRWACLLNIWFKMHKYNEFDCVYSHLFHFISQMKVAMIYQFQYVVVDNHKEFLCSGRQQICLAEFLNSHFYLKDDFFICRFSHKFCRINDSQFAHLLSRFQYTMHLVLVVVSLFLFFYLFSMSTEQKRFLYEWRSLSVIYFICASYEFVTFFVAFFVFTWIIYVWIINNLFVVLLPAATWIEFCVIV